MAVMEQNLVGIGRYNAGSGLRKAKDAKTEMMKIREIVDWPGGMVEMRLDLAC